MHTLARTLIFLALAAPTAVPAQDLDGFSNPLEGLGRECLADDSECFELFNRCEPIAVAVGVSDNEIRLTEERVRTAIESRLRAARLYDLNVGPYLLVTVDLVAEEFPSEMNIFTVSAEFRKWMLDELTGHTMLSGRWEVQNFGQTDDAGFILQIISEQMDRFINDYLRVNGPACD